MATVLVEFDVTMGEVAEGLAVTADTAYVGFAGTGEVVGVSLPGAQVTPFGNVPPYGPNEAFLLGLLLDNSDQLYAGLAPFVPTVVGGVYRWPSTGGLAAVPFAADPAFAFPNGLVFAASGNLLVSDSSGVIHEVTPLGVVSEWLADPLLQGVADNCPNAVTPFPIGTNGIVVDGGNVYVANTNMATIVRIPVMGDGSAGTPELFAGPDCNTLGGADGLAIRDTDLYVAVNALNSIAIVSTSDGSISELYTGDPLQSPASVAFGGPDGNLYVTNAAFAPGQTSGLVEITMP